MIYAMEAVGLSIVKFGRAKNPRARLDELKTGCPVPVELITSVDWPDDWEGRIHRRFAVARTHGEWFAVNDDIAEFINVMLCPNATAEQKRVVAAELLDPNSKSECPDCQALLPTI